MHASKQGSLHNKLVCDASCVYAHVGCWCGCHLQVIRQHQLALGSLWDVPWASSAPFSGSKGSNGGSSCSGTNGNGRAANSANSSYQPISSLQQGSRSITGSNGNGHGLQHGVHQQEQRLQQHSVFGPEQAAEFTTWKFRSSGVAKRTIDYIWFSKQQLVPISRWRMLSEAEIGPHGLPNMHYPSDHMCVTCQLGWTD
eukprot:GHUV01022747.1.p1 GENE.GHUV01022747.1~~GHUV01022747.1.p1  ORF type:complete len:198 (+),score=62.42 GHUV01022747.1:352-945(+)